MSATNRGSKREKDDFYPTPEWCVKRLIEAVPSIRFGTILEPCAGAGAIIRALDVPRARVCAVEIREEARTDLESCAGVVQITDFLWWARDYELGGRKKFDVAISNPPYTNALDVIKACFPIAHRVAMLLRVSFLESIDRHSWIQECTPDIYVLPNRPIFVRGGSDNTAYAWMLWHTDGVRWPSVTVLNLTPKADRVRRKGA